MTPEEFRDYFPVTFFHSAGRKIAPATAAAACVTSQPNKYIVTLAHFMPSQNANATAPKLA